VKSQKKKRSLPVWRSAQLKAKGQLQCWGHGGVRSLRRFDSDGSDSVSVVCGSGWYHYHLRGEEGPQLVENYLSPACQAGFSSRWAVLGIQELSVWLNVSDDAQIPRWKPIPASFSGFRGRVLAIEVAPTPGPAMVAILSEDEQLSLYMLPSDDPEDKEMLVLSPVKQIQLSPSPLCVDVDWDELRVRVGHDGSIDQWDLKSQIRLRQEKVEFECSQLGKNWILASDGRFFRWQEGDGLFQAASESGTITAACGGADCFWLGNDLGELIELDGDGQVIEQWEAHGDAVIAVCPVDGGLLSASQQEPLFWSRIESEGGWEQFELPDFPCEVTCQVVGHGGRWMALGHSNGEIHVHDLEKMQLRRKIETSQEFLTEVTFSPDDELVVYGSADGLVGVAQARSGDIENEFDLHDESITALIFRGTLVISASSDGLVNVWESSNGEVLQHFHFGEAGVVKLQLAQDQEIVVVQHDSGLVTSWSLPQY
jgi:WD40 repeat protein